MQGSSRLCLQGKRKKVALVAAMCKHAGHAQPHRKTRLDLEFFNVQRLTTKTVAQPLCHCEVSANVLGRSHWPSLPVMLRVSWPDVDALTSPNICVTQPVTMFLRNTA